MGCCESKQNFSGEVSDERLIESIANGTIKQFIFNYYIFSNKHKGNFNINTELIKDFQGDKLNLLSLAFVYGRVDIVRWLHENCSASFTEMEKLLRKHNSSGLDVIAKTGDITLFEYYIPIYMRIRGEFYSSKTEEKFSETLKLDHSEISKEFTSSYPEACFTPIQQACICGNISIIQLFYSFSQKIGQDFEEFDVHYIEKTYGYNCALITASIGNYHTIKYLHSHCKANFHLINYNKESSIQILLAEKERADTLKVLEYLVDTVGVNITYNYEETLILAKSPSISEYLLKKLEEKGVAVNELQLHNEILPTSKLIPEKAARKSVVSLTDMIRDLKKDDVSSILIRSSSQSSQEEAL